jgi:hypothetical protein
LEILALEEELEETKESVKGIFNNLEHRVRNEAEMK